ncbi:hypothetical protein BK133_11035 [Paenibacillus sp. FSL H8-0548]|uniref:hypothetical protein n=1 Tax=Paenibacillus sp. FSL H8-0548 TaxID=1920422 RepID=UPI00096FCF54|nr:hypothetical protein [Paenibacillus sp. FSL H8-0548]OMF35238.1 hypothetical protein BK133_11035 [Paenibacillus sp. FSL H8-0548]
MIKTVVIGSVEPFRTEDCLILQSDTIGNQLFIRLAFPFHDFNPKTLNVSEALSIRNAIDELIYVKLLDAPRPMRTAAEFAPTHVSVNDKVKILGFAENFTLNSSYDLGARDALTYVMKILNLEDEN